MVVRRSVSFSLEALKVIDLYRRGCKGKIPSFSAAVNDLILQK